MSNAQQRADAAGAQRSLTLDEAAPPLCPAPMLRQVIVFWTPRSLLAETLRMLRVVVLKGLRYQGRVYERETITLPVRNERR